MRNAFKFLTIGGLGAAALYYLYVEYRSWREATDRMLGTLQDIHLAFERLNGNVHRLETRLEDLAAETGPAATKSRSAAGEGVIHLAQTAPARAQRVSSAKPRTSRATAKRTATHGLEEK